MNSTVHRAGKESYDDDLKNSKRMAAAPLPVTSDQGYVDHDGLGNGQFSQL
jgi:hypothetical protein